MKDKNIIKTVNFMDSDEHYDLPRTCWIYPDEYDEHDNDSVKRILIKKLCREVTFYNELFDKRGEDDDD